MYKYIFVFFIFSLTASKSWAQLQPLQAERGEYLYPVIQNGTYGYINRTGDMVIPAIFQWGDYFFNGLAAAEKNHKFGFINPKGEWIIEPLYDSVKSFSEGYALAATRGNDSTISWFFIDTIGKLLETGLPGICRATSFHSNRAVVFACGDMEYTQRIINRSGKIAFDIKDFYLDESHYPDFHEGYMRIILPDNTRSFIDSSGHIWTHGSFQDVGNFSEGLAWFMDEGKYGFIDKEGRVVIPASFEFVSDFSEGFAKTTEQRKFDPSEQKITGGIVGYINNKGKYVASPQYDEGGDFHNGFASVKLSGFYGFLDSNGSAAINFQYIESKSFFRGLAFVKDDKHWGYINTSGKKIW